MLALVIIIAAVALPAPVPPTGPARDRSLLHRAGLPAIDHERDQEEALRRLLALGGPAAEQAEVEARLAATLRAHGLALTIAAQADEDRGDLAAAKAHRALAQQSRTEAIERYRELLRRFPRWPRQDEALFFLADALQDSGRDEEALQAARELVTRFPDSQWAPDSHVFLGEQLFDQARLNDALREYRAAAQVKTAEVYPYALYKEAWCRFNQGGFDDAMALLHEVVSVSLGRAGSGDAGSPGGEPQAASKVQLAREARRDYVTVFARTGRPEAAQAEFVRLFGPADGLHMLELYARLLFDTGRDPEAQLVSRQLLALHKDSAGAAADQTRLLLLAARSGKRGDVIREVEALVEVFTRVRAQPHSAKDEEALVEADKLAEESLRDLAVRTHSEARKTGLDEPFASAKALYADYLALFPTAPAAYELRFFDAELLYGLGDAPAAAALYEDVVRADLAAQKAGQKPGRWEDKAAWGAVLARDVSAAGAREAVTQRQLSAAEEQLASACALYLDAVPQGPHAVEVAFKLGRLRYLSGALDQAEARLAWVATQHPESDLAEYAANLVLDIENLRHDSKAVHAWAARFLADKRLTAHGTLAHDLARVEEQSAYAVAEAARPEAEQARLLLDFAQSHPRGELVDKALFGAAAALSREGEIDAALSVRARLVKEQPQSPLLPRAILASADDRAQVGDFGESAALLEKVAANERRQIETAKWRREHGVKKQQDRPGPVYDDARARAALSDAAVLREARGELRLALQDREAQLSSWKTAPDRDQTELAAALLLGKLGLAAQAARRLTVLAKSAQGKSALVLTAWLYAARDFARARETDHVTWAQTELEKAWRAMGPKAREKAGSEGAAAEAEAHLGLGARTFDEYRKQRIEPPLVRTLSRKVSMLQAVKKRVEEVVAMRQAEPAVCALSQLGEAQTLLARGISQSPAPKGLNAEERKLYRAQLDEKAQPLLENARETLRGARDRASELGVTSACAARVQAQLVKLGESAPVQPALPDMPSELAPVPLLLSASGNPLPEQASAPSVNDQDGDGDGADDAAAQIGSRGDLR